MRGNHIILSFIFCFFIFGNISAESLQAATLSESTITSALENGRSLVIAEVQSFEKRSEGQFVKIKIVQPIILGDLSEDDCDGTLDLFSSLGDTYSKKLEAGSRYALFILKDSPYEYSWANRDDFQLINDNTEIDKLKRLAKNAYTKTSMSLFRKDSSAKVNIDLSELPEEIISLCKQFRVDPENRSVTAEKIYMSDISSRIELTRLSSVHQIIPPKIILSRDQIISLLGQPTIKSGRTYSWLCGQPVERGRSDRDVFVLSVTFDNDQKVQKMVYGQYKKEKWTKIDRPVNNLYGLPGQPEKVLLKFQREVQKKNWKEVLSLCSESIRKKALEYESLDKFFKDYLPIEEVVNMREFPANGYSGSSDKIYKINFDFELSAYDPETYIPVTWRWSLVRSDDSWLVDYKVVPLEMMIQKEIFRRKLREEDYETRNEKFKNGIRYNLIPLSENYIIGKPMPFRIEMKNISEIPVLYMATNLLMINDPMNITGPNDDKIEYVDIDSQTVEGEEVVLSGETVVLEENYDVCSQYYISKPGRYSFQFNNTNKLEIDIKQGELLAMDEVYTKLKDILPQGWAITRRMASTQEPYMFVEQEDKYLFVHMVGKRRGLQIDNDIRLAIVNDTSEINPKTLTDYQKLGSSKYGEVLYLDRDAESLWPDNRSQIIKALGIK